MNFLNVEIKAKIENPKAIRTFLNQNKAVFIGVDVQQDTYFNVKRGRLKLRIGNIESNLIYYERTDTEGPKNSYFQVVNIPDSKALKEVLEKAIGIKIVVEKKREI